jgi:hypothetical protein
MIAIIFLGKTSYIAELGTLITVIFVNNFRLLSQRDFTNFIQHTVVKGKNFQSW